MKDPRARGEGLRPEPSRIRSIGLLVVLAVVMAIAGPLTAVAVGDGGPGGSGGGGLSGTVTTPVTSPTTTTSTGTTSTGPTTSTTTTSTGTTTTGPYTTPPPVIAPGPAGNPFRSRGMWIWVLASSNGGAWPSIVSQAHAYGIKTLFIKSGDGTGMWPQFTPTLVSYFHQNGLHVCAWQFVYGSHPVLEANVADQAVKDGADCLAIDAEGQYQGKYVAAQQYLGRLRRLAGARYPLALAGFPYVDYHPGFPYSVFLGYNGAQVNEPQMYWKDIGTSVASVFAHTYAFNELYQRPIAPLGQLYANPPLAQIRQFRQVSRAYAAPNVSWWDWQSASVADFGAAAQKVGPLPGFVPQTTVATIGQHAIGDLVVWAQEHLVSAGMAVTIDGDFGPQTLAAVQQFQTAHGIPVSGAVDPQTWTALLHYPPAKVTWVTKNKQTSATVARAAARRGRGVAVEATVPRSASRHELRNELAGAGGAGRP